MMLKINDLSNDKLELIYITIFCCVYEIIYGKSL